LLHKDCTDCKLNKPIDDFHKCKLGKFGRRNLCKICTKKYYIAKKQTYGYYVYFHVIKLTGEIFYIGSGCGDRAWKSESYRRNDIWHNIVRDNPYGVVIVAAYLSKEESLKMEIELQSIHSPRASIRIGNKVSERTKVKLSRGRIGKYSGVNSSNCKAVINCRGEIFPYIRLAADTFNIKGWSDISRCCRGKLKTAGKYPDGTRIKWNYYENPVDILEDEVVYSVNEPAEV